MTSPTHVSRYLGYRPDQWADEWFRFLIRRAIDDTPAGRTLVAVLELHAPNNPYPERDQWAGRDCPGDDMNGYETEPPDWPCSTIGAIAGALSHPIARACPACSTGPQDLTNVWPDGTLTSHMVYPPRPPIDPTTVTIVNGRLRAPRTGPEPYQCPATGTIVDPPAPPAEPLALTALDRTRRRPTP